MWYRGLATCLYQAPAEWANNITPSKMKVLQDPLDTSLKIISEMKDVDPKAGS